jgi:hypothetical protein
MNAHIEGGPLEVKPELVTEPWIVWKDEVSE